MVDDQFTEDSGVADFNEQVWRVLRERGQGRRMSDAARYNAEAGLMQVRFASGGRGTPNVYQYDSIDPETWNDFMAGRCAENGTATAWFLTSWGGVRVS